MTLSEDKPAKPRSTTTKLAKWSGIVIVGFFLVSILVAIFGGHGDPTPADASGSPSESSSPTPTPTPSASPMPSQRPAGRTAKAWAAGIRTSLLEGLGVKQFQQTCPDVSWACAIVDVHANSVGTVFVTEQLRGIPKDVAEQWATSMFNFAGPDHRNLNWVVVEDATKAVAGQVQRSSVPMLN